MTDQTPPTTARKIPVTPRLAPITVGKTTLRVFVMTWNVHGKLAPKSIAKELIQLKSGREREREKYDLIGIGTQECERGIGASLVVESKQSWESNLKEAVGDDFVHVGSSTLGAIHLALFAQKTIVPRITTIITGEVATGVANVVKNKGATSIAIQIENTTTILFINCHLAAGQDQIERRISDWHRIDSELSTAFSQFRPPSCLCFFLSLPQQVHLHF